MMRQQLLFKVSLIAVCCFGAISRDAEARQCRCQRNRVWRQGAYVYQISTSLPQQMNSTPTADSTAPAEPPQPSTAPTPPPATSP